MHVLLISYEFPPKGGPGVLRPAKIARYLAEAGWDVSVLTVADPPSALIDEALAAGIPASVDVRRAWSLEPTRLVQWLRAPTRGTLDVPEEPPAATPGYSGLPPWAIRFVQAFFLPDEKVGWTSYALREAERLHAERPIDVILASGPPFTALRIARKLAARLGTPWVADLRDPIVGNYFYRPPTPLHARYRERFERRVAASASAIVTVTEPMREALLTRTGIADDRVVTVPNGFDPSDFSGLTRRPHDGFRITYVGSFQGSIQPNTFLEAVASASRADTEFARDARVRFVGNATPPAEEAVRAAGLVDRVEIVGPVPHRAAVQEMLDAEVLLLVLGPEPESRAILTGKLPEYMGAHRQILGMVPEGVAADILDRYGAASIVSPTDADAASDAILGMYEAWRAGSEPAPAEDVVRSFDRRAQVNRIAQVLAAVASRGQHGGGVADA